MQEVKYHAVRDQVRDLIEQLEVGDALPAERVLAGDLGVSRMTLRRAIDDLVRSGLLVRRQGAGTFVSAPAVARPLAGLSFSEDMRQRGLEPSSRVVAVEEVHAGPQLSRRLEVSPSDRVLRVVRERSADGVPMALETLHVPTRVVTDFDPSELSQRSYYALLAGRGIRLDSASQTIEPTVTDDEESALLGVPLHSPAFLFERTSRDVEDRVVEFVRSVYRGDRYKLSVQLDLSAAVHGVPPAAAHATTGVVS